MHDKSVNRFNKNIDNTNTISLNGKWQYIVNSYSMRFYDYRFLWKSLNCTERKIPGVVLQRTNCNNEKLPAGFAGLFPWLLNEFRSPRRNNPTFKKGWKNKGLYDQKGKKKKAFYTLQAYYNKMD